MFLWATTSGIFSVDRVLKNVESEMNKSNISIRMIYRQVIQYTVRHYLVSNYFNTQVFKRIFATEVGVALSLN